MKLDRNLPNNQRLGKYALLKLRTLKLMSENGTMDGLPDDLKKAIDVLGRYDVLDWGNTPESEFFVMRLKDEFSRPGLVAYGDAAFKFDRKYAEEIHTLAARSGPLSKFCKKPD
jgi:hypothetical protein